MPGQLQTLAVPPPVSLDTLLYNTYLAVQSGGGGGTGDVVGPASSTDGDVALFSGTTGKLLQDTGIASSNLALLSAAQTFTAANIFSANGAASTPALKLTGVLFTGGSATTTQPLCLIQPTGATAVSSWNTNGTFIGINSASGFAGNFLDFHNNGGSSVFRVDVNGTATTARDFSALYYTFQNGGYIYGISDGTWRMTKASGSGFGLLQFGGTSASFSALKNNGTTLQCRLADDSGFAFIQGKLTTETAYVNTVQVATGYLVIYDSTGTSYRIPALLNP